MSAATTIAKLESTDSSLGRFVIRANYKDAEFVSASISDGKTEIQFKDHLDLMDFLSCVKEFTTEFSE